MAGKIQGAMQSLGQAIKEPLVREAQADAEVVGSSFSPAAAMPQNPEQLAVEQQKEIDKKKQDQIKILNLRKYFKSLDEQQKRAIVAESQNKQIADNQQQQVDQQKKVLQFKVAQQKQNQLTAAQRQVVGKAEKQKNAA